MIKIMKKRTKFVFIAIFFVLLAAAFICGEILKEKFISKDFASELKSVPLRVGGFNFIRPVLLCDTSSEKEFPELQALKNKLTDLINKEERAKHIDSVSVYFQDFQTGGRIDINKDEKFRAASIGKVPIMISYFRIAESNPNILSRTVKYIEEPDFNAGQEIPPKEFAKIGETYTVEELIEKMIKYSDNNSLYSLIKLINTSILISLYQDLQVPFPVNSVHPENLDFITTKDVSYFFRVLYNSTYLISNLSEKALQLLSETDYDNGLVAGVPEGTKVSHKYGLDSLEYMGTIKERELHDCGIIYHPKDHYFLCVMTKSSSGISDIENTIKNISALVYQEVSRYSQ